MEISAYFRLARPLNVLIASLSVLIQASLMPAFPAWVKILPALLTVAFLNAAANAVNDITDIEIDRVNRPERPLPSGRISLRQAGIYSILFFVAGNLLALRLGMGPFIISAVIATPLMVLYSYSLKPRPFVGNLVIAGILGLALIFAAVAYGDIRYGLVPALLAFFVNLVREIIKDLQDMEGDRKRNSRTLPLLLGETRTRRITAAILVVFLLILPLPYLYQIYRLPYLIIVLSAVALPLAIVLGLLLSNKTLNYGNLSNTLKLTILTGLVAIFAGR